MDKFFIFSANYLFILSFIIAGYYFFKQPLEKQIKIVTFGGICALVSYLIALLAGYFYFDSRPFVEGHFKPLIEHDTENGFPSDHVLMISCIAAVMSIFNKKLSILLWLIVLIVAYARVYVGVHHYIDVSASITITILVTFLSKPILHSQLFLARTNYLQRKLSLLKIKRSR